VTKPLRALIVEDSERDADLLLQELRRGGFDVTFERVDTAEAMSAALEKQTWDIVFCDYSMPRLDAPSALSLMRGTGLDLPFIIVSGTVGEDAAVEAMKAGAHDYFRKDKLSPRLVPVIERELREASGRAERRRAESALLEKEAQYRQVVESVRAIVWRADARTFRFTFVSPEGEKILGYPIRMWLDEPSFWSDHIHPDDRDWAVAFCRKNTDEGHDHQFEYRMMAAAGHAVWLQDLVRVVIQGDEARELVGIMIDVTERRHLEDQLRQALKMEAVGQLAGGVAHDFNNLLGVITGYGDLLLREIDPQHRARQRVEEIRKAAERAAALTRQLLAFSRKQVLQPKVLDPNTVVADVEKMLRRLIGEHIQLVTLFSESVGTIKADPGQLEQVIVNLAVNARDAMPGGGKLIIETANVELDEGYVRTHADARPGPHVVLSVSDTGHGMDAVTLSRVFEPFFTTKGADKGTGLGLSTVYGIVKQSGGHVTAYSEPGHGTTFKVYLPRVDEPRESRLDRTAVGETASRGTETVLLAEDEESLRVMFREVLEGAGYVVLEAASPEAALAVSESHAGPIHLFVTDVVMPRMGGQELARRVLAIRPDVHVLFVSGYSFEGVGHQGLIEPGTNFLEKPFTADALLRELRRILDTPAKKEGG
jgi:PAS domain S-box-containing protein